ncbi:hypothetical protein EJB05_14159 [Eragrostis curvula]|uniref:Uncharacterized protein n=1 Tax=Eragrostis curvula TaxID=38414 RepID=A0A5J9VWS9_9POAL|nr:hypothetical protein EJB05_14159 [Eragrostis curvula]
MTCPWDRFHRRPRAPTAAPIFTSHPASGRLDLIAVPFAKEALLDSDRNCVPSKGLHVQAVAEDDAGVVLIRPFVNVVHWPSISKNIVPGTVALLLSICHGSSSSSWQPSAYASWATNDSMRVTNVAKTSNP